MSALPPMNTAAPLLEVRRLRVEFPTRRGTLVAIDDVSFDIAPGEVLGVVGESGAGKSITGAAIIGLLEPPGRVAGGEIRLAGRRIDDLEPAQMRRVRGKQIGAAGAFKIVSTDEIAHHAMFLRIVDIYKKYLPEETLDMISRVFAGFNMPALYLIPNASEMVAALERTKLYTPLKHGRSVANPILDLLGLDNKRALERAVQQAKLLPKGLGPEHVALSRSGEFVVSMQPESSASN